MALIFRRLVFGNMRRYISNSAVVRCDKNKFPDALEHATGLEKKELLAEMAGNDDPFMMAPITKRESSRENPILVESAFEDRIIGCICDEDHTYICWHRLYEGEPQRCECGFWFKLCRKTPITS